jgi:hypothetical protein
VQGCKHELFCFGCIQGKQLCPLCNAEILGWEKIKPAVKFGSAVASIAGEASNATTWFQTAEEELPSVEAHDAVGASTDFDTLLGDSSDDERNFIHWSGDEDFAKGAKRSQRAVNEISEAVHDETAPEGITLPDSPRGRKRTAVVSSTVAPKDSTTCMNKNGEKRSVMHLENQTRIVVKAMDEILHAAPSAVAIQKSSLEGGEYVEVPAKKRCGRPPGSRRAATQTTQPSGGVSTNTTTSTRCRSGRGRERVTQNIPTKFRGL